MIGINASSIRIFLLDRCVFSFYKEKILNDHNHGIIANTFYC